jgi:hypothetical protein
MGGFKINGPPRVGKGPMESEESLRSSNEASLPQPTQAGRIETCTELIRQAMRCLENNDKRCVTRLIEELVKNQCHNGNAVGKEIADRVRGVVHELWLVSDNEHRCGLLKMLKDLDVSKGWVKMALSTSKKDWNKWLVRCGIDWEGKATRNDIVSQLEDLLRRMGWSEVRMCEELWRFVGVDVDEFRRHGIEPCSWLNGLEELSDLRRPYWLGLRASDLTTEKFDDEIALEIGTTNSIDAVFFPVLLGTIKTPGLAIKWKKSMPAAKYVSKSIGLSYYVDLGTDKWPWPIELSVDEFERMLNGFGNEELTEFVAGEIDGDGVVWYDYENGYVAVSITACKNCPKRLILDVLKEVIARRFGIVGNDGSLGGAYALVFGGEDAVKLLRRVVKYIHHPLRRLRAELILAHYEGRIDDEELEELYKMTKYEQGKDDIKRNRGLEALARAAPQTHTHGDLDPWALLDRELVFMGRKEDVVGVVDINPPHART